MLWLLYASLSALFSGIKDGMHRYIMRTENAFSYAFSENIISSLVFLPLLLMNLKFPTELFPWILTIISSIIWASIIPLVFLSHKHTEASIRAPINQTKILFVFILSILFLSETITLEKVTGTLLIFAGLVVLTYHQRKFFGKLTDKGVQLTLLSALLVSVAVIIDKKAITYFMPETYVFFLYFLPAIIQLPFLKKRKTETKQIWKNKWRWLLLLGFLNINYLLSLKAYQLADISLVYPIMRLSSLITITIGFGIYKEKGEILKRIVGAIIMILGAVLISGAFGF